MQSDRREYAGKRRLGTGARLVKLPGAKGFTTRTESPEVIAKRIRLDVAERRAREREH